MLRRFLSLLVLAQGCQFARTQTVVVVRADRLVETQANELRVEVRAASNEILFSRSLNPRAGDFPGFPLEIPVTARRGEANRIFEVRVVALSSRVEGTTTLTDVLAQNRARTSFVAGRVSRFTLWLLSGCRCNPETERCVPAPNDDLSALCEPIDITLATDSEAGIDSSVVDVESGVEAGFDAAVACEAATPNRCTNACVNFASDRTNCGACGRTCIGTQLCRNGDCVDPPACTPGDNSCPPMNFCASNSVCTQGCDGQAGQCATGARCDTSTHTCVTHGFYPEPHIVTCPSRLPVNAATPACISASGDASLLIVADVLVPGTVFEGGAVLVDASGVIRCVGCDCANAPGATAATRITCQGAVLSPGLINAHDHLSFQGTPYLASAERYEHRHQWRRGDDQHTRIPTVMATLANRQWGELRGVLAGTTATVGFTTATAGFLRNLDSNTAVGPNVAAVEVDTFPLGDTNGYSAMPTPSGAGWTGQCSGYDYAHTSAEIRALPGAFAAHVAEGIGLQSYNEILCTNQGSRSLLQTNVAIVGGVSVTANDIAAIATNGTALIWSPRSNTTIYGETARVTEYARLGATIGLGTDWITTGSMNLLRELRCAEAYNQRNANFFSDEALWLMVTRNNAIATRTIDAIGTIEVGKMADLSLFDARVDRAHRAVLNAQPEDVLLVLRSGTPLYGASELVARFANDADCSTLTVCGRASRVCMQRELALSFDTLTTQNANQYPLFFCGEPDREPSCVPARTEARASVMGSSLYTSSPSADDTDGDGVPNANDNCPAVFNPIRPFDRGMQADADGDRVGDSCDNCILVANVSQADADRDAVGNACD